MKLNALIRGYRAWLIIACTLVVGLVGVYTHPAFAARQLPVINAPIVQSTSENSASSVVERDSNGDAKAVRWNATTALKSDGGLQANVVTKTSAYTATESDYVIVGNPTGGSFSITLPAAATSDGFIYVIKNIHASNTVTIDGNASETIDGATTVALSSQYAFRMIICDGTSWHVIGS